MTSLLTSTLKALLEGSKENKLIDNIFNYYFEGRFVPTVITENKIVFYVPGSQQYFISEYALNKDGISLDGIMKLSFEKEIIIRQSDCRSVKQVAYDFPVDFSNQH